ncbi:hypothetical protein ACS5PN_30550 [Roseateles sp. NT4]|uniref:hypothetical protein n=1 Tax=Roseateles sp. NT4 TaxID=3453715 RepID=UPI003EE924A3
MTLIAAFEFHGQSALIGDLLLTQDGKWGNPPATLPSRVDNFRPQHNFTVAGLERKIVLINDHFALAWACNDVRTAHQVIAKIKELDRNGTLTWDSISDAIDSNENSDKDRLTLIFQRFVDGKLVTGNYEAYSPPAERFKTFANVVVAGSGTNHFINLLGMLEASEAAEFENSSVPQYTPSTEEVKRANWEAMCTRMLGLMTMSEHRQGDSAMSLAKRYGGGYEIAYFDGEKFRHFSDYSIQLWDAQVDGANVYGPQFPTLITSTHYLFDHLIIKATKLLFGEDGQVSSNQINFVIAPFGSPGFSGDWDVFDRYSPSVLAVAHVIVVRLNGTTENCILTEWVPAGASPRSSERLIDGKMGFSVDRSLLREFATAMLKLLPPC